MLSPTPSSRLNGLYAAGLLHPTRQHSRDAAEPSEEEVRAVAQEVFALPTAPSAAGVDGEKKTDASAREEPVEGEERMLLRRWNGKLLAESVNLPGMELEIERAVEQVERDIAEKAKQRQPQQEPVQKAS